MFKSIFSDVLSKFQKYDKKLDQNLDSYKNTEELFKILIDYIISINAKNDFKLHESKFKTLCSNLVTKLKNEYPKIDNNSFKKSIYFETRILKQNEFIIKNTIQKLGDGWGHYIYCHKNNFEHIKNICKDISPNIEIKLLKYELNRNLYNNILYDLNFWNEIHCEKIFFYQSDTIIFENFNDDFLEFDWIGESWSEKHMEFINEKLGWNNLWGCNGGLNLRTVSTIIEILKKEKIPNINFGDMEKIPEDTFFSWHIMQNYKFPYKKLCEKFSENEKFFEGLFGSHRPWLGNYENFSKKVTSVFS